MKEKDLKQHLLDFLKGLAAAIVTTACLSALQYIGAHIPDLIQLFGSTGTAVAVIKATRGYHG